MSIKYGASSQQGRYRRRNEDAFIVVPQYGFYAMADGMGGMANGAETSAILSDMLPALMKRMHRETRGMSAEAAGAKIALELQSLSDNLYKDTNDLSFGSTLTAVWFRRDAAIILNIGDSRTFCCSSKEVTKQITVDHNLAQLIREAGGKPSKRDSARLTRFFGMPDGAKFDVFIQKRAAGDRFLLASDGLYDMFTEQEIAERLFADDDAEKVATGFADEAVLRDSHDNCTAVCVFDTDGCVKFKWNIQKGHTFFKLQHKLKHKKR